MELVEDAGIAPWPESIFAEVRTPLVIIPPIIVKKDEAAVVLVKSAFTRYTPLLSLASEKKIIPN